MQLDNKRPILVFTGSWNISIFTPAWIARYLFDRPEGDKVELMQIIDPNRGMIYFIDDIGISVKENRVEIFLNKMASDTLELAEKVSNRLIDILCHTPMKGYGINFSFIESDPSDDLLDSLKTKDQIDAKFKIIGHELRSTIELEDKIFLNFSRKPSENTVVLDFNYHSNQIDKSNHSKQLDGIIRDRLDESLLILKDVYNIDADYTVASYLDNPNKMEEEK